MVSVSRVATDNVLVKEVCMKFWKIAVLLCCVVTVANAAESLAAKVNGVAITQKALDEAVKQRVTAGAVDSPELRTAIKDELLTREVLTQEAQKLKLDQTADAKEQKKILEQNLLIELLFNDHLLKNPVTDAAVKEEFDRQLQEAKTSELQEYRVRNMVLQKEADAKSAISRIKKGSEFATVEKEFSADSSTSTGGDVGWLLAQQIIPQIRNVVVNLNKGSVINEPIRTAAGWHVVKLEDMRPFKAPAFEEVKNQIKVVLVQKKRSDLITRLKQQSKIE